MTDYIRTFSRDSYEYNRLKVAAAIMTAKSPRGYHYRVDETYFDFGQDWKWTTILSDGGNWGGYQALSPRDQEEIILSDNIEQAVDIVFADKFCPDKIG